MRRTTLGIGVGILSLMAVVLGVWWWMQPASLVVVEEPLHPRERLLSALDQNLRMDPYFDSCVDPIERYWGGIEQHYTWRWPELPEAPYTEEMLATSLVDMFNFFGLSLAVPMMTQEVHQERLLLRYGAATGIPFGEENHLQLVQDRAVEIFAREVVLHREVMGEPFYEDLGTMAILESVLHGHGLLWIDWMKATPVLSDGERQAGLEALASVVDMTWSELETLLMTTAGVDNRLWLVGVDRPYDEWFREVYGPMVEAVAAAYSEHGYPLTDSLLLREIASGKLYHPLEWHFPDHDYHRVVRACMTPVLYINEPMVEEVKLSLRLLATLPDEEGVQLMAHLALARVSGIIFDEELNVLREQAVERFGSVPEELNYDPMVWAQIARLQHLFDATTGLSGAALTSNASWQKLVEIYQDDVDTTLEYLPENQRARDWRVERIEAHMTTVLSVDPALWRE